MAAMAATPYGSLPLWLEVSVLLCVVSRDVLRSVRLRIERYRIRRRITCGLCPACGYDLTGNVSGVCPECGRAQWQ